MIYNRLGNSGIKVSQLSFGNWLTGDNAKDEETQISLIKLAYDSGINFFDTAEVYGQGNGEILMGKGLKALNCPRSDLVVSTKLFWGKSEKFPTANCKGLSRKHIVEGMKDSLSRLQLDYVDIVFCHRPDIEVGLEETCKAMSWLVDQGYSLYWGTSEWPASYIAASIEICDKLHLNKPVAEQPQYNMLARDRFEKEYRTIFELYKYGTTIWSPLASGLLSGKYNNNNIPDKARLEQGIGKTIHDRFKKKYGEELVIKLNKLAELAKEFGCTQAQLALLWTLTNKDVSTCILGASKIEQLQENIDTLKFLPKWNKDIEERVNIILDNSPEADFDVRLWAPRPSRRQEHLEKLK
jgi:voltage-dependent potassium channel beta subunit